MTPLSALLFCLDQATQDGGFDLEAYRAERDAMIAAGVAEADYLVARMQVIPALITAMQVLGISYEASELISALEEQRGTE